MEVDEGTRLFNDLRNILYSDDTEDDLEENERLGRKGHHDVMKAAGNKGVTEDLEIRPGNSNGVFESESEDVCTSENEDACFINKGAADSLKAADSVHEYHDQNSRNNKKKNSSSFVCTKCDFTASSLDNLKYHKQNAQFEDSTKCKISNGVGSSEPDLDLLMENFLSHEAVLKKRRSGNKNPVGAGNENIEVHKEGASDDNLQLENTNIRSQSQTTQYNCDKCRFFGKSFRSLMAHKRLTHTTGKYKCKLCHYSAVYKKYLKKHMSREHKEQPQSNPLMKKKSFNTRKLMLKKSILVKCEQCEFITNENYIKRHMTRVHSHIRFPCTICNIKYKELYTLKKHIKTVHNLLYPDSTVQQTKSSVVQHSTGGTVQNSPDNSVQLNVSTPEPQGGSTVQSSDSSTVQKSEITVQCGENVLYSW